MAPPLFVQVGEALPFRQKFKLRKRKNCYKGIPVNFLFLFPYMDKYCAPIVPPDKGTDPCHQIFTVCLITETGVDKWNRTMLEKCKMANLELIF